MSIRPIGFLAKDSKNLVLKFNKKVKSADPERFKIFNLDGSGDELKVISLSFEGSIVTLNTDLQKSGMYYSLVIEDHESSVVAIDNDIISDEKIKRTVYFVGFEKYNPIRDSILTRLPKIFLNNQSLIKDVISEQAVSLYDSRKSTGQLLSDNYLRQEVIAERRVRSSGPMDRLANENCFKVSRVSRNPSSSSLKFKRISYESGDLPRHSYIDSVVSLQEEYRYEEMFVRDIKDNTVQLSDNIIKLLEVSVYSKDDDSLFDYPIEEKKYSIFSNKYDKNFGLQNSKLKDSDFKLEKSFLESFSNYEDKIFVKYLTKNREINPVGEVYFFQVLESNFESVSEQSSSIFLKNGGICDHNGEISKTKGVSFFNAFDGSKSEYFISEIPFGSSVPSSPGEYSINYETGEVFVFGEDGTGIRGPVVCSYKFRRVLVEDYDFYIYEKDIVINSVRININNYGKIQFSYENVFEEGYHYVSNNHVEVMPENIGANLTSSFSFRVKNSPITNVFRVVNKTTQEIYGVVDFSGNEIFISGNQSPRIDRVRESARFLSSNNERLIPSESFISRISDIIVKDFDRNNLYLANSITESIFDKETKYFVSNGIKEFEVTEVLFENGIVHSLFFRDNIPNVTENLFLGTKCTKFSLKNKFILSKNEDNIGSYLSSSITIKDSRFLTEKPSRVINNSLKSVSKYGSFNETYLSKSGNYIVDYIEGEILLCLDAEGKTFGDISYKYSEIDASFGNSISINSVRTKTKSYGLYEKTEKGFFLFDLPSGFEYFDKSRYSGILESDYPMEMKDDFTVIIPEYASNVRNVFRTDDFFGSGSISDGKLYVPEKENILDFDLSESISFSENKIDFKQSSSKFFSKKEDYFYFDITESDFESFFSLESNDYKISSDLIIVKSEVSYFKKSYSGNQSTVFLTESSIFENLNPDFDKVLVDGSLYDITSISAINKTVTFSYSGSFSDIYLAQKCEITDGKFIAHESSGIKTSDQFLMRYVPNGTPNVGETFVVIFDTGKVSVDYNYLVDNIQVFYEYGDNEIEWTDKGLSPGEEYFVDYEYGALRTALRVNFGLLTDIPFFSNFSLGTDREVYRDSLEAALKSFKNGPSVGTFKDIASSLSKTSPDIEENMYKGWILGRDFLSKSKIESGGNMIWGPVRYDSGLLFEENYVFTGARDKLSVEEGTISFWSRNLWDKIENDSDILVSIPNFAPTEYFHPRDKNIFNIVGPSSNNGVEISEDIFISANNSGIERDVVSLSPLDHTEVSFKVEYKIKELISDEYSIMSIRLGDKNRVLQLNIIILKDEEVQYRSVYSDFDAEFSLREYAFEFEVTGTEKSVLLNENNHYFELKTPFLSEERPKYVVSEEGHLFEIKSLKGKSLVISKTPINYNSERYAEEYSSVKISRIWFASERISVLTKDGNVFTKIQNLGRDRVDVSLKREENLVSVNNYNLAYSDLPKSSNYGISLVSESESVIKLSRIYIKNNPYFDKKSIFIGSEKANPSGSKFLIKNGEFSSGKPNIVEPGVYFYVQNSDQFDLDHRINRFWTCEIVPSYDIEVPAHLTDEITISESILFGFDAEVTIETESGFYMVESGNPIVKKEKSFALNDEKDIVLLEETSVDIEGVDVLSFESNFYKKDTSEFVSFDESGFFATDSSNKSHKASYLLPLVESSYSANIFISVSNLDLDYSAFYNDIGGFKVISPLFEMGIGDFYVKAVLASSDLLLLDNQNNIVSSFKNNAQDFMISVDIADGTSKLSLTINENVLIFDETSLSGSAFFSLLITDSSISSGRFSSFYPESKFLIHSVDIVSYSNSDEIEDSSFSFNSNKNKIIASFDGTYDGYGYGYGYGYGLESKKIVFVSEDPKYFFDTDNSSISIFRDFDGYLKFKISDDKEDRIISTEMSNLNKLEPHHIAASWKSDEFGGSQMHLFVDGKEAANLIRFGQDVPENSRFGSESKEIVQGWGRSEVSYYDYFEGKTVPSTSEIVTSNSDLSVGDIVVVSKSSSYLPGYAFFVSSISGNRLSVLNVENMEEISFYSYQDVSIVKVPSAKLNSEIYSVKPSMYINENEVGTYIFKSSDMSFVSSDEISLVSVIIDESKNICHFVKKESDGFEPSIFEKDSCYLKTHGLFVENISEKLDFGQNSKKTYSYGNYFEDISSFKTDLVEPISADKVSIRKIISDLSVPEYSSFESGNFFYMVGESKIDSRSSTGLDRSMKISVNSENAVSNMPFVINIYGISAGTSVSESIEVLVDKSVELSNKYSYIEKIDFSGLFYYSDYEPFSFSIEETMSLKDDNSAFVYAYRNGEFLISSSLESYIPVTLSSGKYSFNYKAKMRIDSVKTPKTIYLGSNRDLKFQSKSYLEEFKITEVMSEEIRPNSFFKDKFYDISKEYLSQIPTCPDENTLLLISFNDPFKSQIRKLKTKYFYDEYSKSKYRFDQGQIKNLSESMNNMPEFVTKMSEYGFSLDESRNTFIEVNKAGNSPISEISGFFPKSENSKYKVYEGPSSDFMGSGCIKSHFKVSNESLIIGKDYFNISLWFLTSFDTINYEKEFTLFESNNVIPVTITSSGFNSFDLPEEASEVVSVRVLGTKTPGRYNDNIMLNNVTGRFSGVSGTKEQYSVKTIVDNKTVILDEMLPGKNVELEVFYIRRDSKFEGIRMFVDSGSRVCLEFSDSKKSHKISKMFDIKSSDWNKISASLWKNNLILMFNGKEVGRVSGVYGLSKSPSEFHIGSRYDGSQMSKTLLSNIKISRRADNLKVQPDGKFFDPGYLLKIPSVEDEYTSFLFDFKNNKILRENFVEIFDPEKGLFSFEIKVFDLFDKIYDNNLEELLEDLVNRVKPSHTKAIIRYLKSRC